MKIGLFFGSFNPVHIGHMAIANYFAEFADLDQIWFVVSPQNPLKEKSFLLNEYDRLHLVRLATEDSPKLKATDIEFHLSKPSYTIDTLTHLSEKFPQLHFVLIMGSDNLASLCKWKNHEMILKYYSIYVYPRLESDGGDFNDHPSVKLFAVPLMEISSSFIRQSIKDGKSMRHFLPEKVFGYIDEMNIYRK